MQIETGVWAATRHVRHKCRRQGPRHNVKDKQHILEASDQSEMRQHVMAEGDS